MGFGDAPLSKCDGVGPAVKQVTDQLPLICTRQAKQLNKANQSAVGHFGSDKPNKNDVQLVAHRWNDTERKFLDTIKTLQNLKLNCRKRKSHSGSELIFLCYNNHLNRPNWGLNLSTFSTMHQVEYKIFLNGKRHI